MLKNIDLHFPNECERKMVHEVFSIQINCERKINTKNMRKVSHFQKKQSTPILIEN